MFVFTALQTVALALQAPAVEAALDLAPLQVHPPAVLEVPLLALVTGDASAAGAKVQMQGDMFLRNERGKEIRKGIIRREKENVNVKGSVKENEKGSVIGTETGRGTEKGSVIGIETEKRIVRGKERGSVSEKRKNQTL